jgi:hypothetical protein
MAGHDTHQDTSSWVITDKVVISDLLQACPQAEEILIKYLGRRALCMPGSKTETLEFLSAMNDIHIHALLEELNEVCKIAPTKTGHF